MGTACKNILFVDDDIVLCNLVEEYMRKEGVSSEFQHSGRKAIEWFKRNGPDTVFCDYRLSDMNGLQVLKAMKDINPLARLFMVTGYADVKTAVAALKTGAEDYIQKPFNPADLIKLIKNPAAITGSQHPSGEISGYWESDTTAIQEINRDINLIAPTDYSVIIYGQSGTGKEMTARQIHGKSKRANNPFVSLDCGTLSRELAGSQLFGHKKGSFTGAVTDKIGDFELANNGTLFLNEIGNLPLDIQATLLRVVQEGTFKIICDNKESKTNVRILVASNENLTHLIQAGRFREDLFHRFNEFQIHLPPLCERKEDIVPLSLYFLRSVNRELNKQITGISPEAELHMLEYHWPGNLRELKNAIRRAGLLTKGDTVTLKSLPDEIQTKMPKPVLIKTDTIIQDGKTLRTVVAEQEKAMISETLRLVGNNKTRAAVLLNVDRKTLYNKLREFEIFVPKKSEHS